jgi:succinate dehydrogenase/fumarate reductase flavoprotein subunit
MASKAEFHKEPPQFDETFDVVVVGYGFAGGVSAIQAARAGARVLLIEKMPDPGGISICSHGAICSTRQPDQALAYLRATNAGRTRDDVLQAFAQGMTEVEAYFRDLAKICDAEIFVRERGGNYPLPGIDAFYYTQVEAIPNFDARAAYPYVRGRPGGPMVFKILQDNLDRLPVEIRLSTTAKSLISDVNRQVVGIVIEGKDGERRIKARKGVVLACGGFEANEEMKRQYWQMTPVLNAAGRGNTGEASRWRRSLVHSSGTCGTTTAPMASSTPIRTIHSRSA